jgi:hypothetical protein
MLIAEHNRVLIACDVPRCDVAVSGDDEPDAQEKAALIGWLMRDGKHVCSDCQRGTSRASRIVEIPRSPAAVMKEDSVVLPDVGVVGRALHDAPAGAPLLVEIQPPGRTKLEERGDTLPGVTASRERAEVVVEALERQHEHQRERDSRAVQKMGLVIEEADNAFGGMLGEAPED